MQAGIVSDVAPTLDDRPAATMLIGALIDGMQRTVAIHHYCDSTSASLLHTPTGPRHAPNNVANKDRARTVASPSATMSEDSAGSSTESGEEGGDGRSTPPGSAAEQSPEYHPWNSAAWQHPKGPGPSVQWRVRATVSTSRGSSSGVQAAGVSGSGEVQARPRAGSGGAG